MLPTVISSKRIPYPAFGVERIYLLVLIPSRALETPLLGSAGHSSMGESPGLILGDEQLQRGLLEIMRKTLGQLRLIMLVTV